MGNGLVRKRHPNVNTDERKYGRFRAIAAAYQELVAPDAPPPADPGPAVTNATAGDGLDHRRAELRTRLAQRTTRSLRRAQADARDDAARATAAARARGDEVTAQHFDQRGEADLGFADGVRGQVAALEQELQLITSAEPVTASGPAGPATR